jgi:hypothetical protein
MVKYVILYHNKNSHYNLNQSLLTVKCLFCILRLVGFYDEVTKSETGFFIFAFVMTDSKTHFSDLRTTVIMLTMAQIHRLNGGFITR